MAENSTLPSELKRLRGALLGLLAAYRSAFRQERVYWRAAALVLAEVLAFARHTTTQLLLALGLPDGDWSSWYRLWSVPRFRAEPVAAILLEQTLAHLSPRAKAYVVGVDQVRLWRHSQKMPGTGWARAAGTAVFRPGLARAQRFVHGAWLTPIWNGFSRAIPLRLLPAFTPKAVPASSPARKEWEAALDYIGWVRAQLDRLGRTQLRLLVLADGAYDAVGLWRALPAGVTLLARCAKNRALYAVPQPERKRRGRKRKYGKRQPTPSEQLRARTGWQHCRVRVRGHWRELTYRLSGPCLRQTAAEQPLFLLVVKGEQWQQSSRRKRREPAFYLVNALWRAGGWHLPFSAPELLAWAWQRWELEVAHRELKSGLGLGEKQCWNRVAVEASVQWTGWVYGLLLLAGYQAWGLQGGPATPARWWRGARRWSLTTLWRSLRTSFWGANEFHALWSPTPHDWPKKEAWLAAHLNAALGAARI
jgi:hypothetical protein